jgi:lyso-ornithine lipid O-acyltransferase
MSPTWQSDVPPIVKKPRGFRWISVAVRGVAMILVIGIGLALTLILRLIEAPLSDPRRPVTPLITVVVCRLTLWILGIRLRQHGAPHRGPGVIVANHSSWLDIFALNACGPMVFVSKAEVADWPGIGWLARATGTLFIRRDRTEAEAQVALLQARVRAGQRLVIFPEGTSTDGRRVLPFRPALFQALIAGDLPKDLSVQPVSVVWHAPKGREARFFGWWGGMDFGPHALSVLAYGSGGQVDICWRDPLPVTSETGRKALALNAEHAVRDGHALRL